MIDFDFWYGDTLEDVDEAIVCFCDSDCVYRGNLYKNGKVIGDFSCKDSVEIEKHFREFFPDFPPSARCKPGNRQQMQAVL